MSDFEIGDIVEFINNGNWSPKDVGAIGIITNIDLRTQDDIWITWANTIVGNPHYPYFPEDFKLVLRSKLAKLVFSHT